MRSAFLNSYLFLIIMAGTATGQKFDTGGNGALHGDYFVREILIAGQNAGGSITSAMSTMGLVTFDGAGNFRFAGSSSGNASGGTVFAASSTGKYGVGGNGLMYVQSLLDSTQYAYGGVAGIGPGAFVASAVEGANVDLMVAIPAGSAVNATAFQGKYSAGYIAFPNADVTSVREASLSLTADGQGGLTLVNVMGSAQNLGGGPLSQVISGMPYTLAGEGSGTLSFGPVSSAQVLSGSMNFYLSADGNLFLAGTPGGYDLIVGMRSLTGVATAASWSGEYFTGALEDSVAGTGAAATHQLDAFYGSWNANGQGVSIAHDRFQSLLPQQQVFDYTFDSVSQVQTNGTAAPGDVPYKFTLGAGGKAFLGVGTGGVYSLMVGLETAQYSGTGVYLNPLGVVNAGSFAPITNPIAPGEIVTLYGSGLASSTASASALPLPTSLAGVQVTINGQAVPLFYVTPGQIALLVPQAVSPANGVANATVQVTNNGVKSNAVTVYTNYTSPGVFSAGGNAIGLAAAQHGDYSLITASSPAKIGEAIVLYGTGLGAVSVSVADGFPAPSKPLATTTDTDYVYLGGMQQSLLFNGLTPGLAGLFQLNTRVVSGTPSGTVFADISTPDAYTSEASLAVGGTVSAQARVQALRVRPASGKPGLTERAPRVPDENR
jgi:uncharacterized protein (TIGR03437 family)